jgi:hypothetical protein
MAPTASETNMPLYLVYFIDLYNEYKVGNDGIILENNNAEVLWIFWLFTTLNFHNIQIINYFRYIRKNFAVRYFTCSRYKENPQTRPQPGLRLDILILSTQVQPSVSLHPWMNFRSLFQTFPVPL